MSEQADDSLRRRTLSGVFWRFLGTGAQFASQLSITVVLARLLSPEDFGLVAAAVIFLSFGQLFADLGISQALIQARRISAIHVRVTFSVASSTAALLVTALWVTAPVAARVFESTALEGVLRLLSFNLLFTSMASTSRALLMRDLRFRRLATIDVVSSIVGYGGVAISLAVLGLGVWSLAVASVAQSALLLVASFTSQPHSLVPTFAATELRQLARFGAGVSLERLLGFLALQGDNIVVGKLLGATALGLYSRAYQIMRLPHSYFSRILTTVMFPAVAKIQGDSRRVRQAYLLTARVVVLVVFPTAATVMVLSEELVLGALGSHWREVSAPLAILAPAALLRAVYHTQAVFLKAKGEIYRLVVCEAGYALSIIVASLVGASLLGLAGVAWGVTLSIVAMAIGVTYVTHSSLQVRISDFLHGIRSGLGLGLGLGGFSLLLRELSEGWSISPESRLAVLLLCVLIFTAGLCGILNEHLLSPLKEALGPLIAESRRGGREIHPVISLFSKLCRKHSASTES